jgi:hypothetical protein
VGAAHTRRFLKKAGKNFNKKPRIARFLSRPSGLRSSGFGAVAQGLKAQARV